MKKAKKSIIFDNLPQAVTVGVVSQAGMVTRLCQEVDQDSCDMIELRLDALIPELFQIQGFLDICNKLPQPLLITARHPEEGGWNALSRKSREGLLRSHFKLASLVDVELRSLPEMKGLLQECRDEEIGIVISHHDFEKTPSLVDLVDVVTRAMEFKPDVVKIAATIQSTADLYTLISFLEEEKRATLAVMGMGLMGGVSRVLFSQLGSKLNYGYLGDANAIGQWPSRFLKKAISLSPVLDSGRS
jgi:3-dehydroquinate dehydratase I